MNVGVKEDLNLFQIYEYVSCPCRCTYIAVCLSYVTFSFMNI
jgi:hypothetical protein